jgi:hypothetical protein
MTCLVISFVPLAVAGDIPADLRRLIKEAGIAPWDRQPVSIDETLGDQQGAKASLRQFVTGDQPMIAYQFFSG